jgi:hypothetical protein
LHQEAVKTMSERDTTRAWIVSPVGVLVALTLLVVVVALTTTLIRVRISEIPPELCRIRIRELVKLALVYAHENGGFLPIGEGVSPRAHDSLNVLARFLNLRRRISFVRAGTVMSQCDALMARLFLRTGRAVLHG